MAINFAREEEETLALWKQFNAFETLQTLSADRPRYTFYDGPPFATGLPHYGHLLVSTIKDCVLRYWSMQGYLIDRRFGWDTHGLPIEYEIDKKLGISGRDAVEKLGIAGYNAECKSIVMRYADEWRTTITRLGRWVDFDNDYKTMDASFMESVWWVFQQLHKKDAVYRGYKVMPYSTALATPLSNFETAQNYKDRQDPAVIVGFPLVDEPETSLLIWTTTPWTLPMNLAIAVNADLEYVKIADKKSGKNYVLLESSLGSVYSDKEKKANAFTILEKIKGSDLRGRRYKPVFPYYYEQYKEKAFVVLTDDYVKAAEGVGLVHQAPAYGADDYDIATKNGIISDKILPPNPVDDYGHYTDEVTHFAGMHVKEAEKAVIKHLKAEGTLVKDSQLMHSYPHCPRSDTPLIYRAVSTWFVKVKPIIPTMLKAGEESHWVPSFVRDKRFLNWIANAHDWNVSRNRYWGTPIPLWVSSDYEEVVCVGSIEELKRLSGYTGELTDLHRDVVDEITIPSQQGKGVLRRIPEVFDCWFESGSMPYASQHYPFEKDSLETFPKIFPANFITEGLDQTRGWFYTLLVLGTHLYGVSPFQNCIVNGIVLAEDGKKMSKRLKNYPDPAVVINEYGVDALRLYLINSPVVRAESLRFREAGVKEVVGKVLLPLWNSYMFFEQQVNLLKKVEGVDYVYSHQAKAEQSHANTMDQWILASSHALVRHIEVEMLGYRLYNVLPRILQHLESLTNWYIRLNRDKLKGSGGKEDTITALHVLFETLFILIRALAPFAPFITDKIYRHLVPFIPPQLQAKDTRCIHFLEFPRPEAERLNPVVERRVERMQKIIELGRTSRERRTLGLKFPLRTLVVIHSDPEYLEDVRLLEDYVKRELNVRELITTSDEAQYDVQWSVDANWAVLGKKLKKDAKRVKDGLAAMSSDECRLLVGKKTIQIQGVEVDTSDVVIKRFFKDMDSEKFEPNTDGDVMTILDVKVDNELRKEYLYRELMNRVQQVRKKAGLVPTDDVKIEYHVLKDDKDLSLDTVVDCYASSVQKSLRTTLVKSDSDAATGDGLIIEEQQQIQDICFMLRLLKL